MAPDEWTLPDFHDALRNPSPHSLHTISFWSRILPTTLDCFKWFQLSSVMYCMGTLDRGVVEYQEALQRKVRGATNTDVMVCTLWYWIKEDVSEKKKDSLKQAEAFDYPGSMNRNPEYCMSWSIQHVRSTRLTRFLYPTRSCSVLHIELGLIQVSPVYLFVLFNHCLAGLPCDPPYYIFKGPHI